VRVARPFPALDARSVERPHSFEIVIGTLVDECQYKEYQRFDLPDSAAAYRWLLRHESFVRPETSNAIRRLRMKFRPLHDRVVVKRIDAEDKTAGGIIIPDTAKEKPSEGEVISVGPGGRDDKGHLVPIELKAGDRVLFGKWSGTEVKLDGVDYLIMKESDIMGVLDASVARKKAA
jgi:chaperonin GroES